MRGEVKDAASEKIRGGAKWLYSPIPDFLPLEEIPASEEAGYSGSQTRAKAMRSPGLKTRGYLRHEGNMAASLGARKHVARISRRGTQPHCTRHFLPAVSELLLLSFVERASPDDRRSLRRIPGGKSCRAWRRGHPSSCPSKIVLRHV